MKEGQKFRIESRRERSERSALLLIMGGGFIGRESRSCDAKAMTVEERERRAI